MTALLGILGAAVLFAIFGVLRRGREPERCGDCPGHCGSCIHPHVESPHVPTTDARS